MAKRAHDPLHAKSAAFKAALRAVEEAERRAFVVLPALPSERMLRAGARAAGLDEDTARRVYLAMVRAQRPG